MEILRGIDIPISIVDDDMFYHTLQNTLHKDGNAYIFETLQRDFDGNGRLQYESNIHGRNDFTVWFMEKLGFAWDEVDLRYLSGYLEYFRELGYLDI